MSLRSVVLTSASLLCFAMSAAHADDAVTPKNPPATAVANATGTAIKGDDNAPVTRGELGSLMREALIKNPEMLRDAIKALQEKQQEITDKETKEALKKYADELFKDTKSPTIGAKDADMTIVEFFDYHCGYCKHFLPTVTKITKEDKKLRVIFREFPILSEDSVMASRAALAVNMVEPDKYFAYHTELMKSNGKFDEKALTELAKKVGVDTKKFKTAMEGKAVTEQLDKNRQLAEELGIRGTPAIVFPDKFLPGAASYDDLVVEVNKHRNAKGD